MNGLSKKQLAQLNERIGERKARLLEEIRSVLARSSNERYAKLLGEMGDAGDESVAGLRRDIAEAKIVRDVGEVRDIVAAERWLASPALMACASTAGWSSTTGGLSSTRPLSVVSFASSTLRKPAHL